MSSEQNDVRANLSFSVEVDRTIELVRWLVSLEGTRLVKIVEGWNQTFDPEQDNDEMLAAMNKVKLKLLDVSRMIEQYQNMVFGFLDQSSKELEPETSAPDITVDQLKQKLQELEMFNGFLDKINDKEEEEEDESDETSV